MFDWVKKSRESFEEKVELEKKIENEVECEAMEVETLEKGERLESVEKRKRIWQAKSVCKEVLMEVIENIARAMTARAMEELVYNMLEQAQ